MPLLLSWTDPETGAPYPNAYVQVDDAAIQLRGNSALIELGYYATQTAAMTGMKPIHVEHIMLTFPEIGQLRVDFGMALYNLLINRPEYAGAQLVP